MLENLKNDLRKYRNKGKAKLLARFFKTGPGEYGEGDIFLGVIVPDSRKVAKKYFELPLAEVHKLIGSKIHEERLVAVLILVEKYRLGDEKQKEAIYKFYLEHAKNINNWDLVDLSAPRIVGEYLRSHDKRVLLKLARSKNIWEKRIAMLATFQFIYFGESKWTFKLVKILLSDPHDLIQKACGWMLREAGKRVSERELEKFLKEITKKMPRTMLRYAIERLPERKRKFYLHLK
jgi:3-methyladenine DNA glycosylase AlkD